MPTTALNKIVFLIAVTLGASASLVADESEFPGGHNAAGLEAFVASHQPYPHDLLTKAYRDLLWSELSESPPELAAMSTPGVDGVRAYSLYLYFWSCARIPETEHADEWLSGWAKRTEGADTRELNSIDQRTLTTAERIEFCMPIPPNTDRLLEAFAWLGEAARLDHEVAQITYYDTAGNLLQFPGYRDTTLVERHPELEVEFRETTRTSLASALKRGHPEAYLAMSGAVSGEDPVRAYAFAHAARLLANEEILAAEHHEFAKRIRIQKTKLTQSLTSQEITQAEALARELAEQ